MFFVFLINSHFIYTTQHGVLKLFFTKELKIQIVNEKLILNPWLFKQKIKKIFKINDEQT